MRFLMLQALVVLLVSEACSGLGGNEKVLNLTELRNMKVVNGGGCNLFQGKWVPDASSPLYESSNCPFIDAEFDCIKFGRPDKQFLKYSWKPDSCNIPRFDGSDFLTRWRGKKVMFVGDSLSLNMWESLSCMIYSSDPKAKNFNKNGLSVIFEDYDMTVKLFRTSYLVDIVKESRGRILKLQSIENGNAWKGMDMLIFNSWHWWTHRGKSRGWDYIQDGLSLVKDMDSIMAFYKGLTTWAKWVDDNVDPSKTKVFFQGISPTHYRYASNLVFLLDITTLSQLRKDAHPESYTVGSGMDCSHWCLPGLPDTWNQLLYSALVMEGQV